MLSLRSGSKEALCLAVLYTAKSDLLGVCVSLQIFNEENSLTFFSYSEEEVFEWAQVIENTIR